MKHRLVQKPNSYYLGLFGEASTEVQTSIASTEECSFSLRKKLSSFTEQAALQGTCNSVRRGYLSGLPGKPNQLWLINGVKDARARSPSYSIDLVLYFCFRARHILAATSRTFSWPEHTQGFYSQSPQITWPHKTNHNLDPGLCE